MKKFRTRVTKGFEMEVTIKISIEELFTLHELLCTVEPQSERGRIFIKEFREHYIRD